MTSHQTTPLRIAVVGVGSLGQHHARKLAEADDAELVGVVDPSAEQGRLIAERLETQWFAEATQLPRDLDGVVIASPTTYHHEAALHFLKCGVATFVEKPLAGNHAQAEDIWRTAAAHDALLQVGHIERFNPAFELVRERCGTPLYVRAQRVAPYTFRSTDIGVIHDLMIHDIDLLLDLTGEMPAAVEAFGAVGIGPNEDMAVARLKFDCGVVADLTSSRMNPTAERSLQVWGTDGCVTADLQTRKVTHWHAAGPFRSNPGLVHSIAAATSDPRTLKDRVFGEWIQGEELQGSDADQMRLELENFRQSIRGEEVPRVSGKDGLDALIVAEQVLQSLQVWSYQHSEVETATRVAA
ncbi:MAG: Gfo/Idh/MocA family oxidoreductase [Fuerstiella sp.]